jgi:XTP/dITP diphosphohydrolase
VSGGGARPLLVATHNEHKRAEFERMLSAEAPGRFSVDALAPDAELPPEDGDTFAANALGKARAAARLCGRPSFADDSGIAAAALAGAPGVRSARYAGDHATDAENLDKLIAEVPAGSGLEYVCVIAYVEPGGRERLFEGRCTGTMAALPRGERGFGYDPVFVADDDPAARTMAELPDGEKDAISHRGRAARALLAWLTDPARGDDRSGADAGV